MRMMMSETMTKDETEFKPLEMETVDPSRFPTIAETGNVTRLNDMNTTGHRVFDKAVLVRMDEQLDRIGTIYVPPEHREKQQLAELYGTIIGMGANAFAEAKREAASMGADCDCPQVGDRICIARYAGVMLDPKKVGGGHVRMMNDEDIVAIVDD